MDADGPTVARRALEEAATVLGGALASSPSRIAFERSPHGTIVGFVGTPAARRRVLEVDRRGALLTAARWRDDGALHEASLLMPDGRWLTVEPRAGAARWGASDRLWLGPRPGRAGAEPAGEFTAVDYASVSAIPVLAEPARLPPGGGTSVLNLIASFAADRGRQGLRYTGPFPGEDLLLALLESFRYTPEAGPPLAAFVDGTLAWDPAPHERVIEREGVTVQLRERVDKVTWQGRAYCRPDWQGITRHAPRRVRDLDGAVVCSLWALGAPLEDHLRLGADGTLVDVVSPAPRDERPRPLAEPIAAAVVAAVAATSVPALAPFVREVGGSLALEWGGVAQDLLAVQAGRLRISTRLRDAAAVRVSALSERRARLALGFAVLGEIAALAGDLLRARAQAALAALPLSAQEAALGVTEHDGAAAAVAMARGTEALLADLEQQG